MTLSAALIYQKTKQSELSQVKNLNIWGANLEDVSILQQCTNVETLSLSVNSISSLKHLHGLNHLRELYLRKNKISDIREIMHLARIPTLQILWLSDNPIDSDPQYRLYVIKALPKLTKLDEKDVTDDERALANRTKFSTPHQLPAEDDNEPHAQAAMSPEPAEQKVEHIVKANYPSNVQNAAKPEYPSNQRPASAHAQQEQQPEEEPQEVYEQVYPEQKEQPAEPVQQEVPFEQPIMQEPAMPEQEPVYYEQQPIIYEEPQVYQPQQAQPVYRPMPNADTNKRITLAVLNLIDGLDAESLDTIRRQINALIAAQK